MGLFGDDKAKKEMDAKLHEIEVLKHQLADVREEIRKVALQQTGADEEKAGVHQALNILDDDLAEMKDSFKSKTKVFEQRLSNLEQAVADLRLLARLAIENREELDTIMNILKKIAEPEFKEVVIAHDSELDRFRSIEDEIDELKDKEIVVESADARKDKG